jgi:general secretion pathway protein D
VASRNLLRALIPSGVLLCAGLLAGRPSYAQDGEDPQIPPRIDGPSAPMVGGAPRPGGPAPLPVPSPATPENPQPELGGNPGEPGATDASGTPKTAEVNKPPCIDPTVKVRMDFVDVEIRDLVEYMARITCRNYILQDDLKGKITIISHTDVTIASAYEAFLAALEVAGYTTVEVGTSTKVIPNGEAAQSPVRVYEGSSVSSSNAYITQIFQLDNISVSDISSVAQGLAGPKAKIVAYAPTNTLIVTDAAVNIRRMWKVISQLDVAAPRAELKIVTLQYATATEVKTLIEQIYGSAETTSSSSSAQAPQAANNRRRRATTESAPAAATSSASNVGSEGSYIQKMVADERTNSLILLANEEAMAKVLALIAELDRDVDPASRSQIHVVYLEHAKAEDVAQVLSNLSQANRGGAASQQRSTTQTAAQRRNQPAGGAPADAGPAAGGEGGAASLLDDSIRVTSDENTNSLVIIASPEAYDTLRHVIDQLDIRRKQVFVEVVIMELASEDEISVGAGVHVGKPGDAGGIVLGSAQLGASSLGLSSDLLSGLAMGVFGESITVNSDPLSGGTALTIPAFGIVLNALQSNSQVNILSTPNILTMDNEEAKIVVGRNIPFPVASGRDSNNNPLVTYQREDVAITLKVTPQINESDYVTLEVFQEVSEIEEDAQGLDVSTAGFITSKRSAETTVLVRDNQTVVIGGLMGQTSTQVETKIPLLGDLPLVGALFRGRRESTRKTNLLIFLTPHVIDEPADLEEVYRIKVAQREEFLRRFYGKSELEQVEALNTLLGHSMNIIDEPSLYRSNIDDVSYTPLDDAPEAPPSAGGVGADPAEGDPDAEPTDPEEAP